MEDKECPICYNQIGNVNMCITACNHIFHTDCLMLCGNSCPMCRTSVIDGSKSSSDLRIPPGTYNMEQFLEQLIEHNISIDDLSLSNRQWLNKCKEHNKMLEEMEEQNRKFEEKRKNNIKKTDINKYNLFYGKN